MRHPELCLTGWVRDCWRFSRWEREEDWEVGSEPLKSVLFVETKGKCYLSGFSGKKKYQAGILVISHI